MLQTVTMNSLPGDILLELYSSLSRRNRWKWARICRSFYDIHRSSVTHLQIGEWLPTILHYTKLRSIHLLTAPSLNAQWSMAYMPSLTRVEIVPLRWPKHINYQFASKCVTLDTYAIHIRDMDTSSVYRDKTRLVSVGRVVDPSYLKRLPNLQEWIGGPDLYSSASIWDGIGITSLNLISATKFVPSFSSRLIELSCGSLMYQYVTSCRVDFPQLTRLIVRESINPEDFTWMRNYLPKLRLLDLPKGCHRWPYEGVVLTSLRVLRLPFDNLKQECHPSSTFYRPELTRERMKAWAPRIRYLVIRYEKGKAKRWCFD